MTREDISKECLNVRELLIRDCRNVLPTDQAADMEKINHLVGRVEEEYKNFLTTLWKDIRPDDERTLDDILDKRYNRLMLARDYTAPIEAAIGDAEEVTLWERITNSNYRDIEQLNALVIAYIRDLLAQITRDFMEDVKL